MFQIWLWNDHVQTANIHSFLLLVQKCNLGIGTFDISHVEWKNFLFDNNQIHENNSEKHYENSIDNSFDVWIIFGIYIQKKLYNFHNVTQTGELHEINTFVWKKISDIQYSVL